MHHNSVSPSPATAFSVALLEYFVRLGVQDIVVCPGSRSQALALVAAELERLEVVRLHVRIDERVAGFFALGLAVETGIPPLVVTTSGTAVANLHPAVLEAHHSCVPLVLLTADRPEELRGIRSNQTTVQPDIYGDSVRLSMDVDASKGVLTNKKDAAFCARRTWLAACGTESLNPGPAHLNVAFRMPLSSCVPPLFVDEEGFIEDEELVSPTPASCDFFVSREVPQVPVSSIPVEDVVSVSGSLRTIVVAGHNAGEDAEKCARSGGWPLLAEVSSGARFGPHLVVAGRELLRDPEYGGRVERVIVFGHPTLTREIPALIERKDVHTIVVSPTGMEWFNPGNNVQQFARRIEVVNMGNAASAPSTTPAPVMPETPATDQLNTDKTAREWIRRWVTASRHICDAQQKQNISSELTDDLNTRRTIDPADQPQFLRNQLATVRQPITREMLVTAVWNMTWPIDRLIFAASRLIRDADRIVLGKKIRVHSNRGLAGIDGTLATALGIAVAHQTPHYSPNRQRPDEYPDETRSQVRTGVTRLVTGDLAFLHDVGALLTAEGEFRPRIQVIVGNDGGGTIFDGLEVSASAPKDALRRVLYTPHTIVTFEGIAQAYGWKYQRATTRGELDEALMGAVEGSIIIEVPLER